MPDSPHLARWISLISDEEWDLHFFPVYLAPIHPLLRKITVHQPWIKISLYQFLKKIILKVLGLSNSLQIENQLNSQNLETKYIYPIPIIWPFDKILNKCNGSRLGESEVRAPLPYGPTVLARLIKQLKPDLIHSMEFQHASYNVLRAKEIIGDKYFSKWIATNWGSDIFYYRQFPDHYKQITRLLKNIDYYSCECERDVALAKEMGFSGISMPVFPNTGGFDLDIITDLRSLVRTSDRRVIMVKGYQTFAGRALTALEAVLKCSDILQNYRIIVFSASLDIHERVQELQQLHGLNISILAYSNHEKILKFFAHARIYLGVSVSDGISTSMLEAMATGAFPIQTNTACCGEWINNGISGFIIPPDDVEVIAQRIRNAITDDTLVDKAADINWNTVCERLDQRLVRAKEVAFYDQIFSHIELKGLHSDN